MVSKRERVASAMYEAECKRLRERLDDLETAIHNYLRAKTAVAAADAELRSALHKGEP